MKRALQVIEVLLYLLFMANCFIVLALTGSGALESSAAASPIVLLLLIGLVHRLRCGPSYY